jgi:hypothetical protein
MFFLAIPLCYLADPSTCVMPLGLFTPKAMAAMHKIDSAKW